MRANRTHTPPPIYEDLGDGTFYYNFTIKESTAEEGYSNFDYYQVRCNYPINLNEVQLKINDNGYNHSVL